MKSTSTTDQKPFVASEVAPALIEPNPKNRRIDEDEDDFRGLMSSIERSGILLPLHVRALAKGFMLVDGERRWRAATRLGLEKVPCLVWGPTTDEGETLLAGLVINEQRKNHAVVMVARYLSELKKTKNWSHEELAKHTGLPVDRVKNYVLILSAGEELIDFFERGDLPLRTAVEFIRYERATNEGGVRKLIAEHDRKAFSWHEVAERRKKREESRRNRSGDHEATSGAPMPARYEALVASALKKDAQTVRTRLAVLFEAHGLFILCKDELDRVRS
jgi:ParB family chromosome partitioning protein